jgi:asparagine synthase (glutamine-hydrolysing)
VSAIYGLCGERMLESGADRDLRAMAAALLPRGPDQIVDHIDRSEQVMLGFRFLRTSPGEASPEIVANEDRTLLMVCDGHVFNHEELRGELRAQGHAFSQTHSCELLLHLYETEGVAGWRRADGQFALALWDRRRRRLVLGRDFLGVRPVYYWSDSRGIAFASEIKALLRHSQIAPAVDETAVCDFLTFTSVPGPRTLFRNIRKVPAGTAVVWDCSSDVQTETYWDLLLDPIPESDDEDFYIDRVRRLHRQSVARRNADGPIGALLSGGNDSSANAALLANDRSRTLHTFTVGLADVEGSAKYSDLGYARQVASAIGSQHHEHLLTTDDFLRTIPLTIEAMDDLVSEPSAVFLYHALRLAKDQGLRVVMTGEANDELSCGHGGMVDIRDGYYRRWLPYLKQTGWVRRALARLVPMVSPKRRDVLRRAAAGDEYFWSYETAWMDTDKHDVLVADVRTGIAKAARLATACRGRFDGSPHASRDYLAYIVFAMMQDFYFGNLMLGKLDALAGSLGVEPRCPYTEPSYAHFVYNIPANIKARDGLVKYFFKKAIEDLLSPDIVYRPKQGFRTPVVELFQGALGTWAEPILLETGFTRQGIFRRAHLEETLRGHRAGRGDYANRLWTAMTLNLWYERWMTPEVAEIAPSPVESQCVVSGPGPDGRRPLLG